MKKILIIGASGQIGQCIFRNLNKLQNIDCKGTYSSFKNNKLIPLNISNYVDVRQIITQLKPDIDFLPACITNVDQCEENIASTYAVNVIGVKNVVDTLIDTSTKLVYFSSDYVFDGVEGLYDENSIPNPINEYGRQKLLSEQYIVHNLLKYTIIRTSSVYGLEEQNKNFICRLLKNLEQGTVATIPKDEQCTPTYNEDLARYAIDVAFNREAGIYHAIGHQSTNRYKFALEAARTFNINTNLIKPILSHELNRSAKRPLNAGLSTIKHKYFMRSFDIGLKHMKKHS